MTVHGDREQPHPGITVAAVIATCNRPALLRDRALRSVARQQRAPEILVVVDDSEPEHRPVNREVVANAHLPGTRVLYVENARTRGASGAWNTALARLAKEQNDPTSLFVAVLDDDDVWSPTYLDVCADLASAHRVHMVAVDLLRFEVSGGPEIRSHAPAALEPSDFLVGNPGIQGSSLFVRLDKLLAAGMFDEGLSSATDRDLCIRLSELPGLRYHHHPEPLVHHYAESNRERLSTKGSDSKLAGLTAFWRKYRGRMDQQQRSAFVSRAQRLFGWQPGLALNDGSPESSQSSLLQVALVVGIIADVRSPDGFQRLLDDLVALAADVRLVGMDVVLLENGSRETDSGDALSAAAERLRSADIGCFVASVEDQAGHCESGVFGPGFERAAGLASIATARSMLQVYAYLVARKRKGAVVWILDGDSRLDALAVGPDGRSSPRPANPLDVVADLRARGVDVAIGSVTGAPPLPFASCIRTQVVDALHNLAWLATLDPDDCLPDRAAENMSARSELRYYYYDLSRAGHAHLETPFWYVPSSRGASVRAAFTELVERLPRVIAGEQVFRPLLLDASSDPLDHVRDSCERGGNTLILDIEALWDFPNPALKSNGGDTRRSDMLWCLMNRHLAGRTVVQLPFAVRQDRTQERAEALDLAKLASDMQGHALALAVKAVLEEADNEPAADQDFAERLSRLEPAEIREYALRFLEQRIDSFVLGFHRVRGVLESLKVFVEPSPVNRCWWLGDAECAGSASRLCDFLALMQDQYDLGRLAEFIEVNPPLRIEDVVGFLSELEGCVATRTAGVQEEDVAAWFGRERARNTSSWVQREYGAEGLQVLGSGAEAVVHTDGHEVYKCLDCWKSRMPREKLLFLRQLVGYWRGLPGLVDLREVRAKGSWVIIRYPYEESEPYVGGHGPGLARLLRSCCQAGIVCNNIHPDNLRVVDGEVKLVDWGADIVPYSEQGYQRMLRRAWLSWKHPDRIGLKELMRRSLLEPDLPELEGWQMLQRAVELSSKEQLVDEPLLDRLGSGGGRRLLDYGCGKGKLAEALATRGWAVSAFDPDPMLADRWSVGSGLVRYLGRGGNTRMLDEGETFDVVVCSLVLCLLDEQAHLSIVEELRDLAGGQGRILVAICNPRFIAGTTSIQKRLPPSDVTPRDCFDLVKEVASTGRRIVDKHRPLEDYQAVFARCGLAVQDSWESDGVDMDSFEPTSDFMLFDLSANPGRGGTHGE